jgi:hypothetical protein
MYRIVNGNLLIFQISEYSTKYYSEIKNNKVYSKDMNMSFDNIQSWVNSICKETKNLSTDTIHQMIYLKEASTCDIWYNLSMINRIV